MKTIDLANTTGPLAQYLEGLDEPLVIVSNGTPVATLVPLGDEDMESIALALDARFVKIIETSRARQTSEGGISPEEMRRRLKS